MPKKTAIARAVERAEGQAALASAIGVSSGLVWQWLNGSTVAMRHFAAIERVTGVSVSDLLADELAKAAAKRKAA